MIKKEGGILCVVLIVYPSYSLEVMMCLTLFQSLQNYIASL